MKGLIKYWHSWFKNQPWVFKWFLWLILLMPFFAMFHDKNTGFSFLQIVGVLTFFLMLNFILSRRIKLQKYELFFLFFGILFVYNNFIFFILNTSIENFGYILRNLSPLLLYFYLRRVVKSRNEFDGILLTFLVASIFPIALMLYEFLFAPIKEVYTQESRGSFLRLSGFYADIFSYMAYTIGDFIIISYFLLRRKLSFLTIQFVMFIGLILIGLLSVSHQASWGVFLTIFLLFLWFSKGIKKRSQIFIILIIISSLSGGLIIEKYIAPLFNKEIDAYQGNIAQNKALNGRIIRWEAYFNKWTEMSSTSRLFGVGGSGNENTKSMMSGGMHSDYVRLLFTTGYFGILFYILFYISLSFRRKGMQKPEKFIISSAIAVMLLYAISANPFGSSGSLIYITMATFAFCAISNNRIYGNSKK